MWSPFYGLYLDLFRGCMWLAYIHERLENYSFLINFIDYGSKQYFLLILLAALVVIPRKLYGKPKSRHFSVRMMYSEKARLFVASLLGVSICVFHMIYYSIYPLEKGLLVSSLYVFFCFMSKKNMKFLMFLAKSEYPILLLSPLAIVLAFIPHFSLVLQLLPLS